MFETDTIIYILLAILILVVASYFYLDYLESQNISELETEETIMQETQQPVATQEPVVVQESVDLPLASIEPYSGNETPAPI